MAALHAVSDDFCPASPMPVLVLFEHVKFAQNDRRLGRAKILDPRCGGFAEPSTMLAAVGAVNFAGMWSFRWTNDADVAAARALPIEGPIEPHLEADQRRCRCLLRCGLQLRVK